MHLSHSYHRIQVAKPQIVVTTRIILKNEVENTPDQPLHKQENHKRSTYWKLSFVIMFAFDASHAAKMMKLKMAM